MSKKQGIFLAVIAFSIYIVGGIACFGGVGLIIMMKGRDLWGLGEGRSLGYLFLLTGAGLSVLGVLLMRIFRNRGL